MTELAKKFKKVAGATSSPHYEVFIEGDWNDADYVSRTNCISVDKFENTDLLLYFISFLQSNGHHFEDSEDWKFFCNDDYDDIRWDDCRLPITPDFADLHSVTKITVSYIDGNNKIRVEIPEWRTLFENAADKKEKLENAVADYYKNN